MHVGHIGLKCQTRAEEADGVGGGCRCHSQGGARHDDRHIAEATRHGTRVEPTINGIELDSPVFPRYSGRVTGESMDDTDWRLLEALQRDGRASYADLARTIAMSPSAVTERVRRLEEAGVITGYAAVVNPDRLGLNIMGFV